MARDTDFLDLYKILGVSPDCELAEFKQAYRRRVVALHPDRRTSNGHTDAIANERLQRLTALYGAAMVFQRQHGRLPGATRARTPRSGTGTRPPHPVADEARPRSRRLLLLLAISGAAWLLWSTEPSSPTQGHADATAAAPAQAVAAPSRQDAAPRVITLGTHADVVRRLEGAPIIISGDRWDYGPSWILIENHKVVDWYSSPVRPLKTASAQPGMPL